MGRRNKNVEKIYRKRNQKNLKKLEKKTKMAKRLRIEDQIEKSRNLGNWESLREGKITFTF